MGVGSLLAEAPVFEGEDCHEEGEEDHTGGEGEQGHAGGADEADGGSEGEAAVSEGSAQEQTAVQGLDGEEIDEGPEVVDPDQGNEGFTDIGGGDGDEEEGDQGEGTEDDAGDGTGGGDQEILAAVEAGAVHDGGAAEAVEDDFRVGAIATAGGGMAEFMDQDGDEDEDGPDAEVGEAGDGGIGFGSEPAAEEEAGDPEPEFDPHREMEHLETQHVRLAHASQLVGMQSCRVDKARGAGCTRTFQRSTRT